MKHYPSIFKAKEATTTLPLPLHRPHTCHGRCSIGKLQDMEAIISLCITSTGSGIVAGPCRACVPRACKFRDSICIFF